jgi:hypothetical protein
VAAILEDDEIGAGMTVAISRFCRPGSTRPAADADKRRAPIRGSSGSGSGRSIMAAIWSA